jgi:predicted Zn-dependent protease
MRRKAGWLVILLFLSGCTTIYNSATGKHETLLIDTQEEVSLGRDMDKQVKLEIKLLKHPQMQERLNSIGNKIAAVSDRQDLKYYFNIVDDREFNAFAIPGGNVYVNSGLIQAANDDELAAVLGHEVGHIAARHSVKRLQAVLGYQLIAAIALGASGQPQIVQAVDVAFNVVVLGYSRKDEYLADKLGIKYANAARFNPQGMVTFFLKLQNQGKNAGLNLVFLSSHPPIEDRIKQAEKQIAVLN